MRGLKSTLNPVEYGDYNKAMKTEVIPTSDPRALEKALEVLRQGGLAAFPTDTVYGVAADLNQPRAIQRLYEAKGRDAGKAIAVLIGSAEQIEQVTSGERTSCPIGSPVLARRADAGAAKAARTA